MNHINTMVGGIDIGKAFLDLALLGGEHLRVANDPDGWSEALAFFKAAGVARIGLEASGGYERGLCRALRRGGLDVNMHQPAQVRMFARMTLQRAKNDRLDAHLIARFTAFVSEQPPAPENERQHELADHQAYIDQLTEDIARLKTRREHCADPRIAALVDADITALARRRRSEQRLLEAAVRQDERLARRLDLLVTIPGIGMPTALALMIGMPELGRISREEAASLIGLAPFDDDTGQHKGTRHIWGGRARPRKALYAAALPAAFKWNDALKAFYKRLIAKGKTHKQALVACARKLVVYANTVLARDTPWQTTN